MLKEDIKEITNQMKYDAQKEYAESKKQPLFIMRKGCWSCGEKAWDKITIEKASSELITGCPRCGRTFCD